MLYINIVLFSKECVGKSSHQQRKSLVSRPFDKWKNAMQNFKCPGESQYHQSCALLANNFMKVHNNVQKDILRHLILAENRKKLIPIIETIKLCGRQELALRGTCDSGSIKFSDPEPEINDSNFPAILQMRGNCGDSNLIKHCEIMIGNATYFSPLIQN